jgi:hypothetical protein
MRDYEPKKCHLWRTLQESKNRLDQTLVGFVRLRWGCQAHTGGSRARVRSFPSRSTPTGGGCAHPPRYVKSAGGAKWQEGRGLGKAGQFT